MVPLIISGVDLYPLYNIITILVFNQRLKINLGILQELIEKPFLFIHIYV